MKKDIVRLFCLADDFLKAPEEEREKSKSRTERRGENRREIRASK